MEFLLLNNLDEIREQSGSGQDAKGKPLLRLQQGMAGLPSRLSSADGRLLRIRKLLNHVKKKRCEAPHWHLRDADGSDALLLGYGRSLIFRTCN